MNFSRASIEGMAAQARRAVWAGALLLAGCGTRPLTVPQLTGNQGGLLPGMVTHDWQQPAKPNEQPEMVVADKNTPAQPGAPIGYSGINQQVLPDGHIVAREFVNGQLLSQTWFSSLRLPERAVYYINGVLVGGVAEFGPDGKITKETFYYVGSKQPERIEEFAGGSKVARFTTYWPNGNLHIISDTDLPTSAGPINRVQEWYENGKPKSDSRIHVERDAKGLVIQEEKQGRQTAWDENGYVILDLEYDHDTAVYDYMTKKKISPPVLRGAE